MRRKLGAALRLPRQDWPLLVWSWWALLFVDLALRCLSLPRAQALLTRLARPPRAAARMGASGAADVLDLAARHHPLPVRCLQRTLVLQILLAAQGLPAELRIGVRRADRELRAHAWLEHAGQALCEAPGIESLFFPLRAGPEAG